MRQQAGLAARPLLQTALLVALRHATCPLSIRFATSGCRCRWFGDAAQLHQLLPLEASLSCDSSELPVRLEATREGRFECTYTPPSPGYWRLHIACRGQPLPRTPFSVHVADPAAAAPALEAGAAPAADSAQPQHDTHSAADGGSSSEADAGAALPSAATPAAATGPAPAAAPLQGPVRDQMRVWEQIAAAAFAADGSTEGWDSDGEREGRKGGSGEDKYIQVRHRELGGLACCAGLCC